MSNVNQADIEIASAKEAVKKAIKSLSSIVVDECHGSDNIHIDRIDIMRDQLKKLLNISADLRIL